MKYLLTAIILFASYGCKNGKLEYKVISGTCNDVDYLFDKNSRPIDIAKGSDEYTYQQKKIADSMANLMSEPPKEVTLVNTSTSKTKSFTIQIVTEKNRESETTTEIHTLFPGEHKKIGCTYFGYKLFLYDGEKSSISPITIGKSIYKIIAEFEKK